MSIQAEIERRLTDALVLRMRRAGVELDLSDPAVRTRVRRWREQIMLADDSVDVRPMPEIRDGLPALRQLEDPRMQALVGDAMGLVEDFLGNVYEQLDADLPTTADLQLAEPWNPDRHPRWPKGTPGVTKAGHPLAGKFMETSDLFDRLRGAISGTADVSFLAHGSTHIKHITAGRDGNAVSLSVLLDNGRTRKIGVASEQVDSHQVISAIGKVENDARGVQTAGAPGSVGAPAQGAPTAPVGVPNPPAPAGVSARAPAGTPQVPAFRAAVGKRFTVNDPQSRNSGRSGVIQRINGDRATVRLDGGAIDVVPIAKMVAEGTETAPPLPRTGVRRVEGPVVRVRPTPPPGAAFQAHFREGSLVGAGAHRNVTNVENLPTEQQQAWDSYRSMVAVNPGLREAADAGREPNAAIVAPLDASFAPVKKDIVVERIAHIGVGRGSGNLFTGLTDFLGVSSLDEAVGVTFTDAGYSSTTTNKAYIKEESGRGSLVFEIKVPKGQKAIAFERHSELGKRESEVVLPRNSHFRIVGHGEDRNGATRVYMEVVDATQEAQGAPAGSDAGRAAAPGQEARIAERIAQAQARVRVTKPLTPWLDARVDQPEPGSFDDTAPVKAMDAHFESWNPDAEAVDTMAYITADNDMNTILRDALPANLDEEGQMQADEARAQIEQMDAAIEVAPPLTQPTTVWRAVTLNALGVSSVKDLEGKQITDQGFTSVTVSRPYAEWFAADPAMRSNTDGEMVLIKMTLPAGQKAAWLKPYVEEAEFDMDELLLPHGMTFEFGKVERDAKGRPIIGAAPVSVEAGRRDGGAAPSAPAAAGGFDTETWALKPVPERVGQFQALDAAAREALADPQHTIPARIDELLGPARRTPTAEFRAIVNKGLMDRAIAQRILTSSGELHRHLTDAGASRPAADAVSISYIRYMAAQEHESLGRTLGDHGVRHLLGDSEMAKQIVDQVPGHDTPTDYALILLAGAFHDAGYMTPPSRVFLDKDHPAWSVTNYDHNLRAQVEAALGQDGAETLRHMIDTHADTDVDWTDDSLGSAFRLADNLALFHDEKMPGVVFHVPANADVLARYGNGDISLEEARSEMRRNISLANLPQPVVDRLQSALSELSPFLPKNALGMLGGKIEGFQWSHDHLAVKLHRDDSQDNLARVLDVGQRQFKKLAEAYLGEDGAARFRTDNRLELNHPRRGKVVEFQITGDPVPEPDAHDPVPVTTDIPNEDRLQAVIGLTDLPPPPEQSYGRTRIDSQTFIANAAVGYTSNKVVFDRDGTITLPTQWRTAATQERQNLINQAISERFSIKYAGHDYDSRHPLLRSLSTIGFQDANGEPMLPPLEPAYQGAQPSYPGLYEYTQAAYAALRGPDWQQAIDRYPGVLVVGRAASREGWPMHPEAARFIRAGDTNAPYRLGTVPINPDLTHNLDIRLAPLRQQFANNHSLTEDDYVQRLADQLDSQLAGRQLAVRVKERALAGILRDGRLKPVAESGRTGAGGVADRRITTDQYLLSRNRFENRIFAIPQDESDLLRRPIYGYLTNGDPIEEDGMEHYGRAVIILKPHVRDRATMTVGDSLDGLDALGILSGAPMPINSDPVARTRAYMVHSDSTDPLGRQVHGYIEAQIHGGDGTPQVTLEDIAEIQFVGGAHPSAAVKRELNRQGISWRQIEHRAPETANRDEPLIAFRRRADLYGQQNGGDFDNGYRPEGIDGNTWYTATHGRDAEGFFHLPPEVQRALSPDGPPEHATYDEERFIFARSRALSTGRYSRPPTETAFDRLSPDDQERLRGAFHASQGGTLASIPEPEQTQLRQLAHDSNVDLTVAPSHTAAWEAPPAPTLTVPQIAQGLSDAIYAAPALPQDAVLWRGVEPGTIPEGIGPGGVIPVRSFVSTTTQQGVANTFAGGGDLLEIRAPAGAHALWRTEGGSRANIEREVILPPSGRFQVQSVTAHPEGGRNIVVEWVPTGQEPKNIPATRATGDVLESQLNHAYEGHQLSPEHLAAVSAYGGLEDTGPVHEFVRANQPQPPPPPGPGPSAFVVGQQVEIGGRPGDVHGIEPDGRIAVTFGDGTSGRFRPDQVDIVSNPDPFSPGDRVTVAEGTPLHGGQSGVITGFVGQGRTRGAAIRFDDGGQSMVLVDQLSAAAPPHLPELPEGGPFRANETVLISLLAERHAGESGVVLRNQSAGATTVSVQLANGTSLAVPVADLSRDSVIPPRPPRPDSRLTLPVGTTVTITSGARQGQTGQIIDHGAEHYLVEVRQSTDATSPAIRLNYSPDEVSTTPPPPPVAASTAALNTLAVGDGFFVDGEPFIVRSTGRTDGRIRAEGPGGRIVHWSPSRQVDIQAPPPPEPVVASNQVLIAGVLWTIHPSNRADGRIRLTGPGGQTIHRSPAALAELRGGGDPLPPPPHVPPTGPRPRIGQVVYARELRVGDLVIGQSGEVSEVRGLSVRSDGEGQIELRRLDSSSTSSWSDTIPLRFMGRNRSQLPLRGNMPTAPSARELEGRTLPPLPRRPPPPVVPLRRVGGIERRSDNDVTFLTSQTQQDFDRSLQQAGVNFTASHALAMWDSGILKARGIRTTITRAHFRQASNTVDISVEFHNPNGGLAGSSRRLLNLEDMTVYHSYLSLSEGVQDGGITRDLFASMVGVYNDIGIKEIGVSANIDVGGYAWGRYGFISDAGDLRNLKSRVETGMWTEIDGLIGVALADGSMPAGKITRQQAADLKDKVAKVIRQAKDTIDLSGLRVRLPEGITSTHGSGSHRVTEGVLSSKDYLLNSSWGGKLDLTPTSKSYKRMLKYLGEKGITARDLRRKRIR